MVHGGTERAVRDEVTGEVRREEAGVGGKAEINVVVAGREELVVEKKTLFDRCRNLLSDRLSI